MKKDKSLLQQFVEADPDGKFLKEVINNKEIKEGFKFATDLYSKGHTEGQAYAINKVLDLIKSINYPFRDSGETMKSKITTLIKSEFKDMLKTA